MIEEGVLKKDQGILKAHNSPRDSGPRKESKPAMKSTSKNGSIANETTKLSTGKLKPSDFVHLHNHTHHSVLDGLTKIPKLVKVVKEMGMEAVAITDHGTLSGAIEFYKTCKDEGIKPIIGIETYVAARTIADRDAAKDKQRFHLILLAMNNQGYENLMRLSSIANTDGFYFKPRVDHELLEKYSEGVIALSGCIGGELGSALRDDDVDRAREVAKKYKSIYGDRYYFEVQAHGHREDHMSWDEQVRITGPQLELAKELDIQCVVTADAHYLSHDDQEAHEALLCVGTGSFVSEEKRMSLKEFDLSVRDAKQVIDIWGDEHPDLITNTKAIADRCDVEIKLGEILIPNFDTPRGMDEKSYLRLLTYAGAAWRYSEGEDYQNPESELKLSDLERFESAVPEQVKERIDYELGVIDGMGFSGYFLIVWDFIKWGKDQGIVFGPGRGSAAGSVVSYALKITELDPLHYDLLFERFLNPDRISMPDIDIDIQDDRRGEVIEYCVEKYGEDRVAHIVTFGTMAGRAAIRDVSRVMEVPYAEADRLAKLVPAPVQGRHIPLDRSIKEDPDFKAEYNSNPNSKRIIDLAIRLEGTIRSHGVHAAGVVIAPDELVKYCPIEVSQKGPIATQYPMNPVEELGLLKMDFLGLSNLTIVKNALRIIKAVHGKDISVDDIPLDDSKAYELFASALTNGVFQFESSGMRSYLRKLKPTEFNDLIAMVALYRPGPLSAGLTDRYIVRKNGEEKVTFEHPLMEPALKDTYGVVVYQEQIMQIAREVCGFTGGQADTLRKAIGKKKLDVMEKMKIEFIDGAVKNGVEKTVIEKFWQDLLGFADYCFNKSHAACYALVSYWTGYLKAHYPAEFMASLMTSNFDNTEKLASEIGECRKIGLEVMPPDVNESFEEFGVVGGSKRIRFGLMAIKNFGLSSAEHIVEVRKNGGKFTSLSDFIHRVEASKVNRKGFESLIKSGAFDSLAPRDQLIATIDEIVAFSQRVQKEKDSMQVDLFAVGGEAPKAEIALTDNYIEIDAKEKLLWEKELLGVYISAHPLDGLEELLTKHCIPINQIKLSDDGKQVTIGGSITTRKEIVTRKGQKMAFITLEDFTSSVEVIAFPDTFATSSYQLESDKIVVINGKVSTKDSGGGGGEEVKILISEVREVTAGSATVFDDKFKTSSKPKSSPGGGRGSWQGNQNQRSKPMPSGDPPPPPKVSEVISVKEVFINVDEKPKDSELIKIRRLLQSSPGQDSVVLVMGSGQSKKGVRLPFKVAAIDAEETLQGALGKDRIVVR